MLHPYCAPAWAEPSLVAQLKKIHDTNPCWNLPVLPCAPRCAPCWPRCRRVVWRVRPQCWQHTGPYWPAAWQPSRGLPLSWWGGTSTSAAAASWPRCCMRTCAWCHLQEVRPLNSALQVVCLQQTAYCQYSVAVLEASNVMANTA
jgi:hypothetical protein